METTKLSAKGRVVLAKGVRVAELAGMLKQTGRRAVSLKAMNAAIESEIRTRRARGRY